MDTNTSQIFTEIRSGYASFWERLGAAILDALILAIPLWIITYLTNPFAGFNTWRSYGGEGDLKFMASLTKFNIIASIVKWLYYALMESGPMQATLGKKALGIKVVKTDGTRITFARATGRYFGKIVSGIILCIGYLMVLWDNKKQALHDKMADTLVVKS